MIDQALQAIRTTAAYDRIAQQIGSHGSADEIAKRYLDESNELYWKKKDLSGAIFAGQCGIIYCLERAAECDAEQAERLHGAAKGLAYNIASFAWRGWDEKGITITAKDAEAGFRAAKLNLELAVMLRRGPKPMMNAHWMVGAYRLADARMDEAVGAFEEAGKFATQSADAAALGMCQAYMALARKNDGEFESTLESIRKTNSEDAGFYVEQLQTARRVFVGK